LNLGLVAAVKAESFGEPGNRTFRILAQTASGQVSLWLEKEQVVMLGSAISELLGRLPDTVGGEPQNDVVEHFVGEMEVKVGALAIGFDAGREGFTLEASDFASPFPITSIHLLATRGQFDQMRDQIDTIVSASRPRCVLCGTPLTTEPHFCPESNGHAHVSLGD